MNSLRAALILSSLVAVTACMSTSTGPYNHALIQNGRPSDAEAYSDFLIARFAAMTNDPEMAAARYADAIDSAPEKSGIADRAVFAALLSGNYEEGVRLAGRAQEVGSEAALVRLTLGVDAMRNGRDSEAKALLEQSRFGPFNTMVARGLSAWRVVESEGADAAVAYLRSGLNGDPRLDSSALYMMGLVEMSAGNDEAALAIFDSLWESGAKLAIGVEAHAQLLASRGERERALDILNVFREDVGHNAALDRLRMAIEQDRPIKVRRLSPREGAALAVYVPAAALMDQTRDDVSAVYFVLALALDPDLHVARSLWGQALDHADRRDEAMAVLAKIPESSAFYATSRGQIAWALRRSDRNESALSVAAEALRHSPDRGLKVQLSDLYRSLEHFDEAEALLDEIVAEDAAEGREDWRVIYARGATREALGDWPSAEADLKQALALQPDNASILNYLGYSYVDRGENMSNALEMIRRAADLEPESGYIIDSLGWAYYRLGRYELATRHLERAVELEPGNLVLNDHLGDAYWQVGRKLEARFQWQRALSLEPGDEDRAQIEAKMLSGPAVPTIQQAETDGAALPPVSQRP